MLATAGRGSHPTCSLPTDLLASYYLLHLLRTAHLLDKGAARLTKRTTNDLDRGLGALGLGLGLGSGLGLGLGLGFGLGLGLGLGFELESAQVACANGFNASSASDVFLAVRPEGVAAIDAAREARDMVPPLPEPSPSPQPQPQPQPQP